MLLSKSSCGELHLTLATKNKAKSTDFGFGYGSQTRKLQKNSQKKWIITPKKAVYALFAYFGSQVLTSCL